MNWNPDRFGIRIRQVSLASKIHSLDPIEFKEPTGMDKQLIERLARDAGFATDAGYSAMTAEVQDVQLRRFAALVAEECAKIAELHANYGEGPTSDMWIPGNQRPSAAQMIRQTFRRD